MRILIVEDEPRIAAQLSAALAAAGYTADTAADGRRADLLVRTESYDAVLLDLGLPAVDGLSLLRTWRIAGLTVPVLVVTARGTWHERVTGIDGGADDYVVKPFQIEEVIARVRALIRRAKGLGTAELRSGPVAVDTTRTIVTLDGVPVRLTSHEYRVLVYLLHQRGRVVSQSELTDHIYGLPGERDSNTVEVFVARLRRKLGSSLVETVRGQGYRVPDA